jgi:hypothetical protein
MSTDPYNSVGERYALDLYTRAVGDMAEAMSDALHEALRRGASQLFEPGYDPYNKPHAGSMLLEFRFPTPTRKT